MTPRAPALAALASVLLGASLLGCAGAPQTVREASSPPSDATRAVPGPPAAPAETSTAGAPAPPIPAAQASAGAIARPDLWRDVLAHRLAGLLAPPCGPGSPRVREMQRNLSSVTLPGLEPRLLEASADELLGKPEAALATWESLVRNGSGRPKALWAYARLAARTGKAARGAAVLSALAGGGSDDPNLAGVTGWLYLVQGDAASARLWLDKTWGTPVAGQYAVFLAKARMAEGDAEGAAVAARLAATQHDAGAEAWSTLGDALRLTGLAPEAAEAYEKALKLMPGHYPASVNLGVLHLARGDGAGAEKLFREAAERSPGLPEAWNNLGLARKAAGDYAGAREALGKALTVSPNFAPALKNLGILYEKYLGQPAQAVPLYDRYLALRAGDADVERWRKVAGRLAEGERP